MRWLHTRANGRRTGIAGADKTNRMHQLRRIAPATEAEALDQYFTKPLIARQCVDVLGDLSRYDCVIEPSAGSGVFLDAIDHPFKIGLDIAPQHAEVLRQDWLKYEICPSYASVLVVGNPPYGQYHRLSTAFLKYAFTFMNVRTIAFILPNVYRKHTRQRIIPPEWRIVSQMELPRNSFTLNGLDYHVPTSFFVLDRSWGPDLRVNLARAPAPHDFEFGSSDDFDLFVFGASPSKVTDSPAPNNRGHFLRAKIPVPELAKRFRDMHWKGNSSASGGVFWLTKHELAEQYAKVYGGR